MAQRGIGELGYLASHPSLKPLIQSASHSFMPYPLLVPCPEHLPGTGAPVPPVIQPFAAEALPLSWKSLHTRIPLFRIQAALTPGPELVRGLWLLLSETANKDVRTSLFVGKTASNGLTISAAQVHVPGQPHSQSCSCK